MWTAKTSDKYSSSEKSYIIKKEAMELLVYLFSIDFPKEIGAPDKVSRIGKYPISVNEGRFNIGYKTKNPSLVRSIKSNLIGSK